MPPTLAMTEGNPVAQYLPGSRPGHTSAQSMEPRTSSRTDNRCAADALLGHTGVMPKHCIVLGLDGSSGADAARDWCMQYAPVLDAEVIAVHAVGVTPEYIERRQIAREALHDWTAPLRERGIAHRTELIDGSPASALNEVATRQDADLIVVGRRGKEGFAELLLGSVPDTLARHAPGPVLIVPARTSHI